MADGVCSRTHGTRVTDDGVFADTVRSSSSSSSSGTSAFSPSIPRSRRRRCRHVKLLLMPEKQISTGETASTIRTLERLLLGMRALMALEVF